MPAVIGIAFSDIHVHNWADFNKDGQRLKDSLEVIRVLADQAELYQCPLYFAGDLIHLPKHIPNKVLEVLLETLKQQIDARQIPFYCISGNHDQSENNTLSHKSPSYIKSFSQVVEWMECLDMSFILDEGKRIFSCGIPYLSNNNGFEKALKRLKKKAKEYPNYFKILMVHADLPGSVNNLGFRFDDVPNIPHAYKRLFGEFDVVLSGHIHKPQQLAPNVFMLGSPIHQERSDEGCSMGYWKILDSGKVEFTKLSHLFPRFISIPYGDAIPSSKDFYIQLPKPSKETSISSQGFSSRQNRAELAKNYCKTKGIRDKKRIKLLAELLSQS